MSNTHLHPVMAQVLSKFMPPAPDKHFLPSEDTQGWHFVSQEEQQQQEEEQPS